MYYNIYPSELKGYVMQTRRPDLTPAETPKVSQIPGIAFENLLLSLIKALLWHANWQTLGLDGSRVRQE